KIQINHYFDTDSFDLGQQKMGLRVREFTNRFEATLKIPQPHGLLEISDELAYEKTQTTLAKGLFPESPFVEQALPVVTSKLVPIGSLKTARIEFPIKEGLLAIDESWYFNKHDYELELEVENKTFTKEDFFTYLQQLNIPYKKAQNKIVRMLNARK
ncbi:MAG: CYTH domain-containing protein, partial [Streptococcaceae bacterium]|nr:CYTH domain-containing protein [Streptococcaceae bacterium]